MNLNISVRPDFKASQVYLILFKNTTFNNFLDLFEEIGDYYTRCDGVKKENGNIDTKYYAFVNTKLSLDELKQRIIEIKEEQDEIVILGMTLDVMQSINDDEMRNWCLQRQYENMCEIIQNSSLQKDIDDFFDLLEKELEKERMCIERGENE